MISHQLYPTIISQHSIPAFYPTISHYIPLITSHYINYILSSWRNHLKFLHNFRPLSATPHPFAALRWHVGGPGHSDQPPDHSPKFLVFCWEIPPKSYGLSENVEKYHENPIEHGQTIIIFPTKTAIHMGLYIFGGRHRCAVAIPKCLGSLRCFPQLTARARSKIEYS